MVTSNPDNNVESNGRGISGSTLKLIAIVTMLIDHIGAVVLEKIVIVNGAVTSENIPLYMVYSFMRNIGRLAFPIFCFLLVEGFLHTRSIKKYAIRLAAFALVSEIPFDLALFGKMFYFGYQNVFFTLLIGLLVLIGFKFVKEKAADKKWLPLLAVAGAFVIGYAITEATYNFINNWNGFFNNAGSDTVALSGLMKLINITAISCAVLLLYLLISWKFKFQKTSIWFADLGIIFAGMLLAYALMTDYSGFGVLTIAVMYGLRKKPFRSMLGGCVTLTVMSSSEIPAFVDLLLILLYNGKRGLNLKYIFYAFYPVHLFILYLVCYFMKLV